MALFVNFSKMEYLRPTLFGEEESLTGVLDGYDGTKSALAILLADGNGRGGGDLRSDHPIIGAWAGDRIGLISDTDIVPEFALPGQESEPLLPTVLAVGTDVSATVLDAIIAAEADYFLPSNFLRNCTIPLPLQRKLFNETQLKELKTNSASAIELFWPLMGAEFKISKQRAMVELQGGIASLWKTLHGQVVEVVVEPLQFKWGTISRTLPWTGTPFTTTGIVGLKTKIFIRGESPQVKVVPIDIGVGFDIAQVFQDVFGVSFIKEESPDEVDQKAKAFIQKLLSGGQQ